MTFITGLICYILGALSSFGLFALCMSAKRIEEISDREEEEREQ